MKKNTKKNAIIYILILLVLIAVSLYFKYRKPTLPAPFQDETGQTVPGDTSKISIDSKNIKEENFTGKVPVISGGSALALKSQSFIDQTVAEFKKQADADVPPMRKEFGADSPTAQYEINIEVKYIQSKENKQTESISMLTYTYTGGAHGTSSYKVITTSADGRILSLGDIIKEDKQEAFTELVKKELGAWQIQGMEGSPTFPEDVAALRFNSFTNWSLDDKNLTIYFSQYDIGPGVLGPVAFPISLSKIKDFLK
ncbi:MAG TPA: DUF3298 domain-containing protein [Candidatus Paceibacterota bacterium]|jgi:hypothetical protein|nr:DUF3298 domain-containing protein [Candidatus Paceibacterota bacterium]